MGSRAARPTGGPVAFDTDVLIWILRGSTRARDLLEDVPYAQRVLPVVVAMELMRGGRDRSELRRLRRFIDAAFPAVAHLSEDVSRRALALVERHSLSHSLAPDDAMIAATALTMRARLATANVKHFRMVSGLELISLRVSAN